MIDSKQVAAMISPGDLVRKIFLDAGSSKRAFIQFRNDAGGNKVLATALAHPLEVCALNIDTSFRWYDYDASQRADEFSRYIVRSRLRGFHEDIYASNPPGNGRNAAVMVALNLPSFYDVDVHELNAVVAAYGWKNTIDLINRSQGGKSIHELFMASSHGIDSSLLAQL